MQESASNSTSNPKALTVMVFPGSNNTFALVEDDGKSLAPSDVSVTTMSVSVEHGLHFTITHPTNTDTLPAIRTWTVVFRAVASCTPQLQVNGSSRPCTSDYDPDTLSLSVYVGDVEADSDIDIELPTIACDPQDPMLADVFRILYDAQIHIKLKEQSYKMISLYGSDALASLPMAVDSSTGSEQHVPENVIRSLAEVLYRNAGDNR